MSDSFRQEITRRGFITKVGQGLVAANLAGTFLNRAEAELQVPDPPGKKLGWAIVGLGSLAINQILPAFVQGSGLRQWPSRQGEQAGAALRREPEEYLQLSELRHHPGQS